MKLTASHVFCFCSFQFSHFPSFSNLYYRFSRNFYVCTAFLSVFVPSKSIAFFFAPFFFPITIPVQFIPATFRNIIPQHSHTSDALDQTPYCRWYWFSEFHNRLNKLNFSVPFLIEPWRRKSCVLPSVRDVLINLSGTLSLSLSLSLVAFNTLVLENTLGDANADPNIDSTILQHIITECHAPWDMLIKGDHIRFFGSWLWTPA